MSENIGVSISAPARLHLGFIDLHGGLGRHYGGVGVALSQPRLEMLMRPAPQLLVHGLGKVEAFFKSAYTFAENSGHACHAEIKIKQTIPAHQGLGSGTQRCLAMASGLARLHNMAMDVRTMARIMKRGRRSGIGIGAFSHGGLLVDGGKKPSSQAAPPLIARYNMPAAWRVLLLMRPSGQGFSGFQEQRAFYNKPDFSNKCAGYLSRLLIMKLMPAVVEENFAAFSEAVSEMQKVLGDYFAFAQQDRFADECLREALNALQADGILGIGQSSWGPTGFIFTENEAQALQLQDTINRRFAELQTQIASFDNQGARLAECKDFNEV